MNIEQLPVEARVYIRELEEKLEETNAAWETKYEHLVEEYRLLLYKRFGRSSERIDIRQDLLFNEGESRAPEEHVETVTVAEHERKKGGRKALDEKIPREEIVHDIPEEEKQCGCGAKLKRIGEDVSERLQVIPEQIFVERHIRPKYACRVCEGSGDEGKPAVRMAPAVPSIIPKSIVTAGLLAFVLVNKFVDHLPFYRQEKRFERIGIRISRQDMSNWLRKAYEAIVPLLELLKGHIRAGPVIQMDETPVQVLGEPERENTRKSYMWVAGGGLPEQPALYYAYHETRESRHVREFVDGFAGYLQSDGYSAYDTALAECEEIIHVGCLAHVRRKFHDAAKATRKAGAAHEAMAQIRKIYEIERSLRNAELSPAEFLERRKAAAEPVLTSFKQWLDGKSDRVAPQSLLGKAVSYAREQWPKVIRYLESPDLTPDTNAAERAIRPFVLGRKNWLFHGSPGGAEASCGIYTLIETAKLNSLNPYAYLRMVFDAAPKISSPADWEALLPWNVSKTEKLVRATPGKN